MSKFFRVGNNVVNLDRVITVEFGPEVPGRKQNYRFRTVLGHHDLDAIPEDFSELIGERKTK